MPDAEDKTAEQLAAEINGSQPEQAASAESEAQSSTTAPVTNDEKEDWGKFNSKEELLKGYTELEHKMRTTRPVDSDNPAQSEVSAKAASFDEETESGILSIVERKLQQEKVAEEIAKSDRFAVEHAEDLEDPLLRGAYRLEILEANARGEYMPYEKALANAKKSLDARLETKVTDAKKETFEEAKQIARRKEQAAAIGGTNQASPDVDESTLSASEYAEFHNIPHA